MPAVATPTMADTAVMMVTDAPAAPAAPVVKLTKEERAAAKEAKEAAKEAAAVAAVAMAVKKKAKMASFWGKSGFKAKAPADTPYKNPNLPTELGTLQKTNVRRRRPAAAAASMAALLTVALLAAGYSLHSPSADGGISPHRRIATRSSSHGTRRRSPPRQRRKSGRSRSTRARKSR